MIKRLSIALAALAWCATSHAQLFSGPSAFTVAPVSQFGPVTNNLILTDTAFGFVVSGQALINVPAGAVQGVLVAWTVDRPLNPLYGTNTLTTTTVLTGFSLPPLGVFAPTNGQVQTVFTNPGAGTSSLIPMSLVNGVDLPAWLSLSATSPTFTYTSGGVATMQQRFQLDGVQLAGPGGVWTIDVPVFSSFNVVPEPSEILLSMALVAGVGMGIRRLRRRVG